LLIGVVEFAKVDDRKLEENRYVVVEVMERWKC